MEEVLENIWGRTVEQLNFFEKSWIVRRYERRASEELWQYENRYDSDDGLTFDSGNDDCCNSDG